MSSSSRPLVIINPRAGGARGGHSAQALRRIIEDAIGGVDVVETERPRHAVELAAEAARSDRELVIATGGDGSIHEVVNGLMAAKAEGHDKTTLGIIGRGTGSDLCKTLGLERRLDRFLSTIAARVKRNIDVGRFSYIDNSGNDASAYFVNILSVGMGGLVDKFVRDTTKYLSGPAAYFIASSRALVRSQVGHLKIRLEPESGPTREIEVASRQIAICNGRYFGSGMQIAPMARVDDGLFEVVDLGAASRLKFAMSSSAMYSGAHMKSPDVQHWRCRKIEVVLQNQAANEVFLLDVDGEPLGRLPITVEVLRAALPVLLPPT